jgi:putative endonuclease
MILFIRVTNNIDRRLTEHSTGHDANSYTAQRLPVKLVKKEFIEGPMRAIKREKQIKNWTRKKKIALINGDIERLRSLEKKRW